jgi:hypothetical protein
LIAELEERLQRPAVGVLPPVAALALACSLFLMWWQLPDLVYALSDRTPIELGAEGDYHLERARSNRLAQLRGQPLPRGWYSREKDGDFVLVAFADTSVMVHRTTFSDEQPGRDGQRPQPRQNPLFARGRLLSRADASRYAAVLDEAQAWSGTRLDWVLLAEQLPGRDLGGLALFGFLGLFGALNAWLLARGLGRRRRSR